MIEKDEVRKYIRQKKNNLTDCYKDFQSKQIFEILFTIKEWDTARNVLLYYSLPDEVITHKYLDKISNEKNLYLPKVKEDTLVILKYNKDKLFLGAFNIVEPTGNDTVSIDQIDTIIVPGMAFDKSCNRLGRGKGYYDSILKYANGVKIGICYDFQLLDCLPVEDHDIKMDIIIHPNGVIRK